MTETLEQTLTAYVAWLERQPLATKTSVAYRLQVHQYGDYLAQRLSTAVDSLRTHFAREYAVRDYKTYLKIERQVKPTSVNLALAAIDHFHLFIGNDRTHVQSASLPLQAPRALKPEKHKAYLRAIERTSSARDKAIAQLLFYTAICLGECTALNLDDMHISARHGIVTIRPGKADPAEQRSVSGTEPEREAVPPNQQLNSTEAAEEQVQTRKTPRCTFSGVVSIELKRFLDSGVLLVECPDCVRTCTHSPHNGVLRFPAHSKRKTRTSHTEQRWPMEKTIWEVVAGERN